MNARTELQKLQSARLEDRYELGEGTVFLSGNQALVRIALDQRRIDERQGHQTGGFISGYRGSPLGRLDMELWRVQPLLRAAKVHFQPGINEDLAATAVWGSQYVGTFAGATVQGVFGIWYGKGPGVDRSGDPLKHGNLAGTSALGGVLVLAGDDHSAKSSTTAHQSDFSLIAAGIPVLYPSNVQEVLDFGLRGIEMSRHTGCWVGLKLVTDVVESAGEVTVGQLTPVAAPAVANGPLHIRALDMPVMAEERLHNHKLPATVQFAKAAGLNRIVWPGDGARIGIVTAGKSYGDTLQALARLGIAASTAELPVRLLKLGMVWPLDDEIVRQFSMGLDQILVVEEKRPLIESQLKSVLFDARLATPPKVVGKFNGSPESSASRGDAWLPLCNELTVLQIAEAIQRLLGRPVAMPAAPGTALAGAAMGPMRKPSFCAGCPHNTSTKVPDGSRALAGIGCHTIAMLNDPKKTHTVSHMGGEGVMWMGQLPFTREPHVFANMGDGTYFHSGYLAIRQAVAANLRMTYKLLFNGFVSMTGGQPIDGDLSVDKAVAQLRAEGVKRLVIVTDDVGSYGGARRQALGVPVFDRGSLEAVQRDLREHDGLSVLIYDQACATEKRRLRKRGKLPDPLTRTYIDPEVCEGCGDCGDQSGCLAIEPLETPLGRKRKINQSSCNTDLSCVRGFCPSFVTLHGAAPRKLQGGKPIQVSIPALPEPPLPESFEPMALLVSGIGGTGVVTIGAVLTMAAHLDDKAGSSLDVTGLSQKYGAVGSHIRLAPTPELLRTARIGAGEADVLLGCDLIVAAGAESLSRLRPGRATAVINTQVVPTSDFTRQPDWSADETSLRARLEQALADRVVFIDASDLAESLLGDAILSNMLLLGYAWQRGVIPVRLAAIDRAIELNAVAVQANRQAFALGRWLAHDAAGARRAQAPAVPVRWPVPANTLPLADLITDRVQRLTDYQNKALGLRYRQRIETVQRALGRREDAGEVLRQVATQCFRTLAVKDEFEVARLYTRPAFKMSLGEGFSGSYKLRFHLAGGPFGKRDTTTGAVTKSSVGGWVMPVFSVLSSLRFLRGTWLDPFCRGAEARLNRRVLAAYEEDLGRMAGEAASWPAERLRELAGWPESVRGYGPVRERQAATGLARRDRALQQQGAA
jgi:indolepyruvate ferredoxin oxidoreductase